MNQWTLILPELLTVAPEIIDGLRLPALEQLLSGARESAVADRCAEQSVLRHAGYTMPDIFSVPAAQLCWQLDFDEAVPAHLLCADPVHLLADKSDARLMDASRLNLSEAEADQLLGALNDTFSGDGLVFRKGSANRWYLSGMDAAALRTLPVKNLVGRNVANFLPEGPKLADWRRLTTEIQMLLFTQPVNQTRAGQGQLPVNALWFWGGDPPTAQKSRPMSTLFADDAFSRAVAQDSATQHQTLAEFSTLNQMRQTIILVDIAGQDAVLYDDAGRWRDWISQLEASVFAPAWQQLQAGNIERIVLNAGNGREFTIGRPGLLRFFRRDKPLQKFLSSQTVNPLGA
ncbi:MAG: hypothetical protein KDJ38_15780 [Gammaproteobacteria bacterium]|nr:hypothetical protein [Gammaproteobacteria bacterium]